MRNKKKFLKEKADKGLLIRHYVFRGLILLMFLIVLYDSFIHDIPFYYIGFLLFGIFIGRIVSSVNKVKPNKVKGYLTMDTSPIGFIATLLLLLIRFIWGRHMLDVANVVWATDALYLIFIGIYWSQWKSMVRQMDEIIYGWLTKNEDSSKI